MVLAITCANEVSPHYFSNRIKFPRVCYACGSKDNHQEITPDMLQTYQSVHPVCRTCHATGKQERTRNKAVVGGKKKK